MFSTITFKNKRELCRHHGQAISSFSVVRSTEKTLEFHYAIESASKLALPKFGEFDAGLAPVLRLA